MNEDLMIYFPDADAEELNYLEIRMVDLDEKQRKTFTAVYKKKRAETQLILIVTLAGFLSVAGIQRFMLGQIGMGIAYLLTGGFCLVGTIIDLINHKQMTWEHNRQKIDETYELITRNRF